jgi:hypothetical protein
MGRHSRKGGAFTFSALPGMKPVADVLNARREALAATTAAEQAQETAAKQKLLDTSGAVSQPVQPPSNGKSVTEGNRSLFKFPGRRLIGLPPKVGARKSRKLGNKFNRCVKSVRSTVRARKGSNKESAAIAICTKSVLQTRGRTMKRYRKSRLVTQKKFRGGLPYPFKQSNVARPLGELPPLIREGSMLPPVLKDKMNRGIEELDRRTADRAEYRLGPDGVMNVDEYRKAIGGRKSKRYTRRR